MSNLDVVNMLITLLDLPEGQQWVSIEELRLQAEKIDDGKK